MAKIISLPHNFTLRPYQKPLWNYLESGGKRAIAAWHRRAGKDEVCMHWTSVAAHQRVGTYWTLLPEAAQARKAIWDAVDPHTGLRRIDAAFPKAIRESTHEGEMKIRFKNGSLWQVVGSDNYHSLVGTPPCGLTFSEWARAVPESYGYLNPILTANNGWAVFISTPLGNNHFKRMLDDAHTNPKWFAQVLSVQASGAIPDEALEESRREYAALYGETAGQALFAQEYECSFASVIPGAYYTAELIACEREGRVGQVDIANDMAVHTAWDLGVDDATAIWCFQIQPGRLHLVDYYENSQHGADHYCQWLNERGYHGVDFVPHDARVRDWGTGRTRLDVLRSLGRKPRLVPNHTLIDGINAARITLASAHFDAARCQRGIECLRSYCAEWDEQLRTFRKTPKHDWSSHGADAFRYLAMSWREPIASEEEMSPLQRLREEVKKPRTWNDVWRSRADELVEQGVELEEDAELFNLNNKSSIEME
jgi:phage terminase large subunit